MHGTRRGRRIGGLAALVLLLCTIGTPRAAAHANLVRAQPDEDAVLRQAPKWLRLWFTEPLEAEFSAVTLRGADGAEVPGITSRVTPADERAMEVTLPTLAPGSYVVAWRTLSQLDGHTARGTYTLQVGEAAAGSRPIAPPPVEATRGTPWQALARWLGALGLALVLGGLVFRAWVLAPALPAHRSAAALAAADRRLGQLMVAGWVLLLTATVVQMVLQVQEAGGAPQALLLGTRVGRLWLLRLGLVAVLGILVDWGRRGGWQRLTWPGVALAGGITLLASLNSHAAAVAPGSDVAVAVDWLHIMSVTTWIGGLAALVWLLPAAGAIVLVDAVRRGRLASRGGAGVLIGALVVFALGAWLGGRLWQPPAAGMDEGDPAAAFRRNPFAPDALSLAAGRTVYEARCAVCHGANGHGDGPSAATLNPAPADFRVHMAAGHTDAQLFQWLSDGVPDTAMPAFADQLSEADRWHVINYIRGFASY